MSSCMNKEADYSEAKENTIYSYFDQDDEDDSYDDSEAQECRVKLKSSRRLRNSEMRENRVFGVKSSQLKQS